MHSIGDRSHPLRRLLHRRALFDHVELLSNHTVQRRAWSFL
jgi:hypothetical protein